MIKILNNYLGYKLWELVKTECVLCKSSLSDLLTTCLAIVAVNMISIIQRQKDKNTATENIIDRERPSSHSVTAVDNSSNVVCMYVSCSVISDSLWPHGLQLTRLLCLWNSAGKNIGVGTHSLLQGISLTQGSNPGLPHCRQILYYLSHQGSPVLG